MNTLAHLLTSITSSDLIEYRVYLVPEDSPETECYTTLALTEGDAIDIALMVYQNATIVGVSAD